MLIDIKLMFLIIDNLENIIDSTLYIKMDT